jgi:Na+/melibiose symporter-like transporter
MTKELGTQQKKLIAKQMQEEAIKVKRRAQRIEKYKFEFGLFIAGLILCLFLGLFWYWPYNNTQERWKDRTYREELEKQKGMKQTRLKRLLNIWINRTLKRIRKLIKPK